MNIWLIGPVFAACQIHKCLNEQRPLVQFIETSLSFLQNIFSVKYFRDFIGGDMLDLRSFYNSLGSDCHLNYPTHMKWLSIPCGYNQHIPKYFLQSKTDLEKHRTIPQRMFFCTAGLLDFWIKGHCSLGCEGRLESKERLHKNGKGLSSEMMRGGRGTTEPTAD